MQRSKGAKNLRWVIPGLLLLGLVLLFFNKMALSNLILARGDTFLYFYPYWDAAAEALKTWRVPLWNDSLFMGVPLLANSQVGFFYPLNWPVWWLLPTPYAVSASILIHVVLAGTGAFVLARRALSLEWQAALLTAVLFSLGGYYTAQVEHINQIQGLAWLPWLLWTMVPASHRKISWNWLLIRGTTVAIFFTLQLFAGHTQTTFISGIAVGVWILAGWIYDLRFAIGDFSLSPTAHRSRNTGYIVQLIALSLSVLLALLVTAVQLLPTLELSGFSARQGGLMPNEVLSFSLNPLLLGRSLLPSVGQSMFSEYVAFLPIVAMVLAVVGAWQWRRWPGVLPALMLVLLGLFLAFGVFNPVYWLLARLPGFNLFRVPARWLVLYGLGMALLAGVGFQILWDRWHLQTQEWKTVSDRAKENLWHLERPLRLALILVILLMAWNAVAGVLAQFWPVGPEAPYEAVNLATLLLWLVEILLVYLIVAGLRPKWENESRLRFGFTPANWGSPWWLAGLALGILFLASRSLPYNNLTTPEAWFDLRPPTARLLTDDTVPPGRLLSLSNIFFDPGDMGEINSIYADQLNDAALYDYIIAIKQKEIIAPNLPLAYGLASVDGFDGGILPLNSYSQLMRLILPDEETTTDGRLREHLSIVPEGKWLDLFNGRYLITDKTGDQWRTVTEPTIDIFFDLQHDLLIEKSIDVAYVPNFPATALVLLSEGDLGKVVVNGAPVELVTQEDELSIWTVPESLSSLSFAAEDGRWHILGATLINEESGTFMPLTLGNYHRIHSGDVKIYENLDVLPRTFFVQNWQWVPDVESTLAVMAEPDFDPGETAVLLGSSSPGQQSSEIGDAFIITYEPEQVVIQTKNNGDGLLLLTDANYNGWQAQIDGQSIPIETADVLFRAVFVPAGEHEVVFAFDSESFENGRSLTFLGLFVMMILIVIGLWQWHSIR